ncbi:MAG TPA: hypothetical protein VH370_18655 [Humisphaera sp.]|jgi:Arc/MetJ-type ribon-helix-helix transcriptional regulator|nr:hypothetical protein [Humisphaera sp.]
MSTLEIPVSDTLKTFLETQSAKAGYSNVNEFVRAILEDEQLRQSNEYVEKELLKGLDSGTPVEVDAEFWQRFRARYRERLGRGKSA